MCIIVVLMLSLQRENSVQASSVPVAAGGALVCMQRRKRVSTSISICIFLHKLFAFFESPRSNEVDTVLCVFKQFRSVRSRADGIPTSVTSSTSAEQRKRYDCSSAQLFCLPSFWAHISILHKILFTQNAKRTVFHFNFGLSANK